MALWVTKSLEELILYSDNSLEGNDLCSASYISVCLQQLCNEEWKLQLFMKSIHIRAYHWGVFNQCTQRPPDLECWISHCNVISGIKKIIHVVNDHNLTFSQYIREKIGFSTKLADNFLIIWIPNYMKSFGLNPVPWVWGR